MLASAPTLDEGPTRARNAYEYALLRVVPRVDREEFINAGVVLYSQDAGFLEAAWGLDDGRASAL